MTRDDLIPTDWLSLPDVAEVMGVKLRDVRNLLRDRTLAGMRRPAPDGPFLVPALFLVEDEEDANRRRPLRTLRGTVMQLEDGGFTSDEAVAWMLTETPALDAAPVVALREQRIHEVRRVAQALAL